MANCEPPARPHRAVVSTPRHVQHSRASLDERQGSGPMSRCDLSYCNCNRCLRRPGSQERLDRREKVLCALGCWLDRIAMPPTSSYRLPSGPHNLSMFDTARVPTIPIRDYFHRLAYYLDVSDEALIHACLYVERLALWSTTISTPPCPRINSFSSVAFTVRPHNLHRLFLTSLLVAAKFTDDRFFNNATFARLGGISIREINNLEVEFLLLMQFNLWPLKTVFDEAWQRFASYSATYCHCMNSHGATVGQITFDDPIDPVDDPDMSMANDVDEVISLQTPTAEPLSTEITQSSVDMLALPVLDAFPLVSHG